MQDVINKILPGLEKPGRYIGSEIGSIKKKRAEISVALVFPDIYEMGMSNYGLKVLYSIINSLPFASASRCFLPWLDMERVMRRDRIPLFSLEQRKPISSFDIVGISVPHELSYTNILHTLELSGLPFFSKDRDKPIIIGGGPGCINPEPIADFFDLFLIGEAEEAIVEILESFLQNKGKKKERILLELSKISGVYVPVLKTEVKKRVFEGFSHSNLPSQILPFIQPHQDRATLEIQRGCTRGCRFCSAGMFYRPVRERNRESLIDNAERILKETGYEEVSLLSLSTADYSDLPGLISGLSELGCMVSVPSLRPDFDKGILSMIKPGSVTLAPEVALERLSRAINKLYNQEGLIETINSASGFRTVKLYFMTGLPTEEDDNLEGIINLLGNLPKRMKVKASISPYVPKPHTPFQWEAFLSTNELKRRMELVANRPYRRNIEITCRDVNLSLVEAVLARGDRSFSSVILNAYKQGAKFESHSEQFDFSKWLAAFSDSGIDIPFSTRKREVSEPLPWDHIEIVGTGFLLKEKRKAEEGCITPDCRNGECNGCGVSCKEGKSEKGQRILDFRLPIFDLKNPKSTPKDAEGTIQNLKSKIRVRYTKGEELRWFSHLDIVRAIYRTLRRANLPIVYTSGFHPRPKVSFMSPALALGKTSDDCEAILYFREVKYIHRSTEIWKYGKNQFIIPFLTSVLLSFRAFVVLFHCTSLG
ncbi:TIGR03960 family B12-binding radical SAM protein [Candidatus Desantisbacteria bacterium]|nr:TIGR03960 family B12-binding radical SAM protein [Candidatus Desantisbacteria bacterium]